MDTNDLRELQVPITQLRQQFIRITEQYRPALWQYCYRLTGTAFDAEDLVQDTLLRAFSKLGYIGQALNPKAYLFRMASNIWINQKKKKSPKLVDMQTDMMSEENPETHDLHEMMEWLIELLPPKQRVVFLLSSSFDFTNREIAEMLGTSEGTIKSYLHRARQLLAGEVKKHSDVERPTRLAHAPAEGIVRKYMDAFNAMDADAILALLDEQATTTIIGDWEELGKEQIKNFSLHYWTLDKVEKWVEFGYLDGEPVLFGMRKNAAGEVCLREVIRLRHDENKIYEIQWNFFTKDLIKYAADKLGLPFLVEGYQYTEQPEH